MKIKGVHYGLSLLYSYLLPLFEIRETRDGFEFIKRHGSFPGIKCHFNENHLITRCEIPSNLDVNNETLYNLLGLSRKRLFERLCGKVELHGSECLVNQITLMFNPSDAKHILEVIVLSRNTDYYHNTVRWAVQIFSGETRPENLSSYIPKILPHLDEKLNQASFSNPTSELVKELLSIKSIGPKTVSALLLHGYGKTQYAPVDRHFEKILSNLLEIHQPSKKYCVENSMQCKKCLMGVKCKYGVSTRLFGKYNGIIQSLSYISARLSRQRSTLENTLVKNAEDFKSLDKFLSTLIRSFDKNKL